MEGICLDNQADVSGFLTIAGFCKDTMGKLRMAQTRPLWYNHRQIGKESHAVYLVLVDYDSQRFSVSTKVYEHLVTITGEV